MSSSLVDHIVDAMDGRGTPALDARILVIGVTTDPDAADVRDSAAVDVILGLREQGAWVVYHDPLVDHLVERGLDLRSVPLDENRVRAADCVALLTPHATLDLEAITRQARLLFDARGAVRADAPGVERPPSRS